MPLVVNSVNLVELKRNLVTKISETDLEWQGRHEREQPGIFLFRFAEQYADSEVHKRFGEVDYSLADVADC